MIDSKWYIISAVILLSVGFSIHVKAQIPATSNDSIYNLPGEKIAEMAEKYLFKKTPQEDLYLYLLRPSDSGEELLPAILYFTGGGWVEGDVYGQIPNPAWFRDHGIIGISADYRVKNRHGTTPMECIKDAKSAMRFVRQHAKEWGIDPERIIAAGGSAGGHIAACTMIAGGDENNEDQSISSVPNALVLHNPVLGEGFGEEFFKEHPEFSPILQITPGWPPTIISCGTADETTPLVAAEKFVKLMNEAGNTCELISIEGAKHSCDWPVSNPNFLPTISRMYTFLQESNIIE
ncbi:MAG TPA: alpha/beta hydrolase [Draconibacterium sp.]|nr:alpha/beta hydrolase [Draconibacterium sp.]